VCVCVRMCVCMCVRARACVFSVCVCVCVRAFGRNSHYVHFRGFVCLFSPLAVSNTAQPPSLLSLSLSHTHTQHRSATVATQALGQFCGSHRNKPGCAQCAANYSNPFARGNISEAGCNSTVRCYNKV
jgi:hypothetical protein